MIPHTVQALIAVTPETITFTVIVLKRHAKVVWRRSIPMQAPHSVDYQNAEQEQRRILWKHAHD